MEAANLDALKSQLAGKGWRLRFPQPLEDEFQQDYAERFHKHMQLAMVLGLVALLAASIGDILWMPGLVAEMWQIRLGIAIPIAMILVISRMDIGRLYMQQLIVTDATIATGGVMALSYVAYEPFNHYYACALTLIMLIVFVLSRQQFVWGVLTAAIMLIIANLGLIIMEDPWPLVVIKNLIFAIGLCSSLGGSFLIERSIRQNYLQTRLLGFENRGLEEANLRLQYLTAIDSLTNIANRRTLDMNLTTEWQRAIRRQEEIALLMIDVDHFKLYNDTYGHQAGDRCLQEVASALKPFARRPGDLAARYGGEEFAVILTATTLDAAEKIAREICSRVAALDIPHQSSQHGSVTVSIGVASTIPSRSSTPEALYERADAALYHAKRGGRNQAVIAQPEENMP